MAYRPSARRNQASASAPKEQNLVPIMNLFLTIMPFLLLMLVITQVAMVAFNFSEGTSGETESANAGGVKKDIPEVTLIIMASRDSLGTTFPGFEIREPGSPPDSLGLVQGQYDYEKLDLTLKTIRDQYPELRDITVAAYDDVLYDDLIKTIDICRTNNYSNVHYKAPQVRYYAARGGR
ncbi:MAG: biopolymer transporter ExbD [Candidatus Syntrophosphaera sp.]|jgi:biopolymer transport protein ExbD